MAERTGAERAWLAGGVLAVALAAIVGWFMVVSPKLSSASATRDKVTSTQDSNLFLQRRVATLQQQSRQMSTLVAQLRAADAALPSTAGVDEFTRQLSSYAHTSHVALTSITVSSPTVADASGPAAAAPVAADPAAAGAPAAGAPAAGAPTVVLGQIYSIEVSIVSNGAASGQQSFLKLVQHGSRAALVTSAALAPPDGSRSAAGAASTLTTQVQVFVEPHSPQDQAELQKLLDAAAN